MSTSSDLSANRLKSAAAISAARSSPLVIRIGSTALIRNGSIITRARCSRSIIVWLLEAHRLQCARPAVHERAIKLLRQIHLAQERLVAGIAFESLEERVALDQVKLNVLLIVGSVEPRDGLIAFAAKRMDFCNIEREVLRAIL